MTVDSDSAAPDFDPFSPPPPLCKHCGRQRGNHQAKTLHCPIGRGSFHSYHPTQVYEPRATRAKKPATS